MEEVRERLEQLRELEAVIHAEMGRVRWLEVGRALWEIKRPRLYTTTHASWKAYVGEVWGWTQQRADQLILAYRQTMDSIQTTTTVVVSLPQNERQARELARLEDPEERRLAMLDAERDAAERGSEVTAKDVKEAADRLKGVGKGKGQAKKEKKERKKAPIPMRPGPIAKVKEAMMAGETPPYNLEGVAKGRGKHTCQLPEQYVQRDLSQPFIVSGKSAEIAEQLSWILDATSIVRLIGYLLGALPNYVFKTIADEVERESRRREKES